MSGLVRQGRGGEEQGQSRLSKRGDQQKGGQGGKCQPQQEPQQVVHMGAAQNETKRPCEESPCRGCQHTQEGVFGK